MGFNGNYNNGLCRPLLVMLGLLVGCYIWWMGTNRKQLNLDQKEYPIEMVLMVNG